MRRGSNNRETSKGVPSSKNNRQLATCRPFRDSCMRTKPNSYRHGSYRLGSVYRQGSKTLFHAYGPGRRTDHLCLQNREKDRPPVPAGREKVIPLPTDREKDRPSLPTDKEKDRPPLPTDREKDRPPLPTDREKDRPPLPTDREKDRPPLPTDREKDRPHLPTDREKDRPPLPADRETDHCLQTWRRTEQQCGVSKRPCHPISQSLINQFSDRQGWLW